MMAVISDRTEKGKKKALYLSLSLSFFSTDRLSFFSSHTEQQTHEKES
jgi:hypothetical protein